MADRVLITDYAWESLEIERDLLERAGAELVVAQAGDERELIELARGAAAIVCNWRPVTAKVLDAAQDCRVVARYGVGLDNIDVERATQLGIVVTNVPDFCVDEVAEHALALILALERRLTRYARQTRAGGWDNAAFGEPRRLRGRTIGLVGTGRLARGLAWRCAGIGLQVIAHSRSAPAGETRDGMTFTASLDELLERADIVSLHVPLTAQTRHMIGARELELMGPGAVLINTARGPVVDGAALADALRRGVIAGAGIDVTEPEPPAGDDPLRELDNAIVTPHAAFYSSEATTALRTRVAQAVSAVLGGTAPEAIVNREVLSSPALRATALFGA